MGNLNFLAFAHILNLCKLASFFFLGVLGIWLPLFADEDSLTKWQGVDQESKNILPKKLPLAETLLYTLTNLDDIKISQLNIVANEGIWQNSAGPFDPTLSCNGNFISTQNTQDQGADRKTDYPSHNSFIQLSANKTARAGTNFSLFAQTSKTHNPLWFPNDRTNNAFISFRINQPLLRGFLFNQNAVNEASNALQIQASRFDTLQTIAQAILNTTNAYWDLVVNQKILAEIKKEEKKLIELTGRIQKLADANIIARGDLEQTKNRLTGRKLQILASEQSLQGSLQQLKFSMGVSVEGFNEDQPDLYELDDFKILELEPLQKLQKETEQWIYYAIDNRFDIRAAEIREESAELQLKEAQNEVLPSLYLNGGVDRKNYYLRNEARPIFNAFDMHGAQTDWHIGLSFSMPFYNDSAKGLERQRSAIKWQSLFGIQRTSQYIAKVIRDIAYNQLSLYYKIKESDSIVKGNTIILSNEIKKLAAGNSSVYDVMNFEDAVLNSTLGSLYLYKEFQQNLATLRFFTNTLISSKNFGDEIEIENPRFLPVLP